MREKGKDMVYVAKIANNEWDGADIIGVFNTEDDAKAACEGQWWGDPVPEWEYVKGVLALEGDYNYYIVERYEVK
jgi:hypothetical protein